MPLDEATRRKLGKLPVAVKVLIVLSGLLLVWLVVHPFVSWDSSEATSVESLPVEVPRRMTGTDLIFAVNYQVDGRSYQHDWPVPANRITEMVDLLEEQQVPLMVNRSNPARAAVDLPGPFGEAVDEVTDEFTPKAIVAGSASVLVLLALLWQLAHANQRHLAAEGAVMFTAHVYEIDVPISKPRVAGWLVANIALFAVAGVQAAPVQQRQLLEVHSGSSVAQYVYEGSRLEPGPFTAVAHPAFPEIALVTNKVYVLRPAGTSRRS
ncbi:MAG: hypothetical protein KDB24_02820 [Microthrixaceae bacterium]|nr:hypothetical protein [Microthrixaceae bacterium]